MMPNDFAVVQDAATSAAHSGRGSQAKIASQNQKPKSAERRRHGSFLHPASRAVAMMQGPVLIVGPGHAGFQVAADLRKLGFADPVHLINDETHLPYQRPPLSKAYLKGTGGPETLMFRPEKLYRDQDIDL